MTDAEKERLELALRLIELDRPPPFVPNNCWQTTHWVSSDVATHAAEYVKSLLPIQKPG